MVGIGGFTGTLVGKRKRGKASTVVAMLQWRKIPEPSSSEIDR